MRLPVILVEHPPANGAALAEALVGNLIGRAGLDLTLVDRFDSLAADSTDRMTLDAITVPSAVLDWRSESQIFNALAAIEFHGSRCPHRLDPIEQTGEVTSPRRLFLFDLTKHTDATKIVAELDRLRESLSVKTFSLGAVGVGSTASTKPAPQKVIASAVRHETVGPASIERSTIPTVLAMPRTDENLDALIDQLDDLDV